MEPPRNIVAYRRAAAAADRLNRLPATAFESRQRAPRAAFARRRPRPIRV